LRASFATYRWGVVEMEMAFLDTLTVVSLRVGETEETLLEKIAVPISVRPFNRLCSAVAYSFSFQKAKAMF